MTDAAANLPRLAANFKRRTAVSLLGEILTSEQGRGEASDYAVNVLRDAANDAGLPKADMIRLLTEERSRIKRNGIKTLDAYLRVSRKGSRFLVSRGTRCAIFVQLTARGLV